MAGAFLAVVFFTGAFFAGAFLAAAFLIVGFFVLAVADSFFLELDFAAFDDVFLVGIAYSLVTLCIGTLQCELTTSAAFFGRRKLPDNAPLYQLSFTYWSIVILSKAILLHLRDQREELCGYHRYKGVL